MYIIQLVSFAAVWSVSCNRKTVSPSSFQSRHLFHHVRPLDAMIERADLCNSNYENDIRYTVQVHKLILSTIGVWPILERSWHWKRLLKRFLNCVCYFLLSFHLIPLVLFMFLIMDSFKARLRMCGALCLYTMVPAMYCALIYQEDRIRECVEHVEEDWRNVKDENDRKIMLDKAKGGRFILITATIFLFTSGFTYRLIQPIARGSIVVNENLTIRPLVQGNYYIFFDPQQSPAYEIVFSVQCLAGIAIYMITASVCGVTALFTIHACGQLEMMISWLENLASDHQLMKDHVAARRLATIIMHHVRIRKFLHRTQDVVGEMCFIEVIGCTLILCLLGYYIITGWEQNDAIAIFSYVTILVSFTFNIFVLCYIGEVLSTQGNKLSTTCCTVDWYCLPNKRARYFIFVIAMSSCPTKIRASKFMDLSFTSFGAVIRTAMAYLNLLRTVTM